MDSCLQFWLRFAQAKIKVDECADIHANKVKKAALTRHVSTVNGSALQIDTIKEGSLKSGVLLGTSQRGVALIKYAVVLQKWSKNRGFYYFYIIQTLTDNGKAECDTKTVLSITCQWHLANLNYVFICKKRHCVNLSRCGALYRICKLHTVNLSGSDGLQTTYFHETGLIISSAIQLTSRKNAKLIILFAWRHNSRLDRLDRLCDREYYLTIMRLYNYTREKTLPRSQCCLHNKNKFESSFFLYIFVCLHLGKIAAHCKNMT